MKSKIIIKIILLLGIALGIIILSGETNVQAFSGDDLNDTLAVFGDVIKGTPTANSLDNIPSTITLDAKEIDVDGLARMIYNQVSDELNKQGIILDENSEYDENANYVEVMVIGESNFSDHIKKSIEKIEVIIDNYQNYNNNEVAKKDITIKWTNLVPYNETDKRYVEEQLSKLPKSHHIYTDGEDIVKSYYMAEQEHEIGTEDLNILKTFKEITGLSFVSVTGTGGGLDPFNQSNECLVDVFKDGTCYEQICVLFTPPTKVTVPNNIEDTDEAYMNYALPKIQKYIDGYYDAWYHGKVSLEKINDYWYKVLSDGEKNCGEIIIKKENGVPVGNNIYVNNLPLNANITVTPKSNVTLENEVKDKGFTKLLGSYEITLTGTDKLNIPIDVTFNIGTEYNGKMACILHKKKDETNEKFEKRVVDGKITIQVRELSPFVIAVKENNDYLLGDVDENGEINAQDAVMILKYVAHNIELTEKQLLAANTTKDEDGTIDAQDAVQILKLVAHNITEF